jgi:RecJ-like exonuclease
LLTFTAIENFSLFFNEVGVDPNEKRKVLHKVFLLSSCNLIGMDLQPLLDEAKKCAEVLRRQSFVKIFSHIDADGLSTAAVLCKTLQRCEIEYNIEFVKQLDEKTLDRTDEDFVVFSEFGSGLIEQIQRCDFASIIIDHHGILGEYKECQHLLLNPHLFGIDGSTELSGSGTALLLGLAVDNANRDLADLAVVGAVGDLQDRKDGRLKGANRHILEIGISSGVIACDMDIRLFGRQTRPVFKLLEYATDPYLPGLSGNEGACINFLQNTGMPLKNGKWRCWVDLDFKERQLIISDLIQLCISSGLQPGIVERLVGEVYTLLKEDAGTALRDATEYATLLNATARYDFGDVGLAVCMGDRGEAYTRARTLLNEHRRNLVDGMRFVRECGTTTLKNIRYFNAGSQIRDTIVGIVAGMCLDSLVSTDKPLVAFAESKDGLKVSARCSNGLLHRGLNLGTAISEAAKKVGGIGGGHNIAAGGTIPRESINEFLSHLDSEVEIQYKI